MKEMNQEELELAAKLDRKISKLIHSTDLPTKTVLKYSTLLALTAQIISHHELKEWEWLL